MRVTIQTLRCFVTRFLFLVIVTSLQVGSVITMSAAQTTCDNSQWRGTFSADCDGWQAGGSYSGGPYYLQATAYVTTGDYWPAGTLVATSSDAIVLPGTNVQFLCYPDTLGSSWSLVGDGLYAVLIEEWFDGTAPGGRLVYTHERRDGPFDCGAEGCRMTGGGVDEFGLWDYTLADGKAPAGKRAVNRYEFGGQAGAPTSSQPQPYGEWVHHQQRGPDGSFVFHAGTASAPPGTEIDRIVCSDPLSCQPARPAPFKQIDFEGVGTFRNIKNPSPRLAAVVPGVTFHWFEVHVEDLGEPGKAGKQAPPDSTCPGQGSPGAAADCNCPDFYRITIFEGFDPATGTPNKTDVIYEVYGYINGGNLQIHPAIR